MDKNEFEKYVKKIFETKTLPNLMNFIRIPNLSPLFDKDYLINGLLLKAATLVYNFAISLNLKNADIKLFNDYPYTPCIFIDINPSRPNDTRTILFYGHFDKQPYGNGWDADKNPIKPVVIDNILYGRGAADDGYALFSILTSIKTCQDFNCLMPRICCIFEGAEESTDIDLKYYFNKLIPILGTNIDIFIPVDSGCGSFDRLWVTSGLRGYMGFDLVIETMSNNYAYGQETSGKVAEPLVLLRKIKDSLMNSETGEILIKDLFPDEIPSDQIEQIDKEVIVVKDTFLDGVPLYDNVLPLKDDLKELLLNNRWRPSASILGIDNSSNENGTIANGSTKASFCFRVPPLVDCHKAMLSIKDKINESIYFGAKVKIENEDITDGWMLTNFDNRLKNILNKASKLYFGNEMLFQCCGGSIPFIQYFSSVYPKCNILCTGICDNKANEHGPNENLNLEAAKKLILVFCYLLSEY